MNKTRYWVKLDSKGKPVLGVLEARPGKPKGGEWMEVNLRPCCSVSTPVVESDPTNLVISCGEDTVFDGDIAGDADAVVADFNTNFPGIGELSTDGEFYYLKSTICPNITIVAT